MSAPELTEPPKALAPAHRVALLATVFVTGAAIMALEIVGTRVVAPVFGVNLFVWTALLSVTLASLAVGYYVGGRLVDRSPTVVLLGRGIVLAAVCLGLERASAHAVLGATVDLGPRSGPLVAATLLFAPSLTALGASGPVAVRLALTDLRAAGRSTGLVYAVSTLGSLAGTISMGFVLIPAFETEQIIVGTALVLGATGAALLLKSAPGSALAGLLVPWVAAAAAPDQTLPPGLRVLDRAASPYGKVEVIEDANRHVRLLRADHSVIGAAYTRDGSAAFSFLHVLEALRFARPNARSLLEVGLGTGALANALGRQGIRVDVIEIDPAVVRFAEQHFGFSPTGDVSVEDARTLLRRTDRRYDLIAHDTFTGGTTPEHLLSLEVVTRMRELLKPGGLIVLNFAGYRGGEHAAASYAVVRTLRAVFPHVRAFWDEPPGAKLDEPGNLAMFASAGPIVFDIPADAAFENPTCAKVLRSFQSWEVMESVPPGPVITDARNPLARLQLPVAEAHFAAMEAMLPRAVWLD